MASGTGNVDLITLVLNLFTQGVEPGLDISDIHGLVEVAEFCNQLPVHERHPYAGQLVHTAFSGSHQDAIRKGMDAQAEAADDIWEVPYSPIDPADIGRTYEAIISVNSQSGKAGSAWLLETEHHVRLPRGMEGISQIVQQTADPTGREMTADTIWQIFDESYLQAQSPFKLVSFETHPRRQKMVRKPQATLSYQGVEQYFRDWQRTISAFVDAIRNHYDVSFTLADFGQNTRSSTSKAEAAAYVELKDSAGNFTYGAGIDTSITLAPIKAIISAVNRLVTHKKLRLFCDMYR